MLDLQTLPTHELLPVATAQQEFEPAAGPQFFFDYLFADSADVLVFRGDVHQTGPCHVHELLVSGSGSMNIVVIAGNLTVNGCLSNYARVESDGAQSGGVNLLVTGDADVESYISTQATTQVRGDLTARHAIYVFFDDGRSQLRVDGQATSQVVLIDDEHRVELGDSEEDFYFDLYNEDFDEVAEALVDEVLSDTTSIVEHDLVIQHLESGTPIARATSIPTD
jgi:hypothetical protein